MPLILDGHNILFAMVPDGGSAGSDALDAARARLVDHLLRHHRVSGETITVVFDSRQLRGGARLQESLPGVHLRTVHPPDTADDEIRRLVEASTAPRRLTVVTSDRELARACSECGAAIVDSGAFLRGMGSEARRTAGDDHEESLKAGRPSREEVREFLDVFGEEVDEESPPRPSSRRMPLRRLRR
jgi:predicted RNA-binding protein with PIN domain